MSPYIKVHNRYTYDELERIFDNTDVLISPSIWYETFGYTVLEALSYGVPVIISSTVGAGDILVKGAGIIIDDISSKKLYDVLHRIDKKSLENINNTIVKTQTIMTMREMANLIENKCYIR